MESSGPVNSARSPAGRMMIQAVGWLMTIAIGVAVFGLVKFEGLSFSIVTTDSMAPAYMPQDVVIAVSPARKSPEVGDAVVFAPVFQGNRLPPHVHRLYAINADGTWTTKGDNGAKPDPWRLESSQITGVVVTAIPTKIFRNPVLLGSILFMFLAIGFWPRNDEDDEDIGGGAEGDTVLNAESAAMEDLATSDPHVSEESSIEVLLGKSRDLKGR
jgi:signal peptidase I